MTTPKADTTDHPTMAIQTIGLTKRFGEWLAIDDVNLKVPVGTAFGFLGHNGAGKTTLIRSLLGLTVPTAGEMRILGESVPAERRSALARVGAIVEEPRFYSHLSGRENLRERRQCGDAMRPVGFPARWRGRAQRPRR